MIQDKTIQEMMEELKKEGAVMGKCKARDFKKPVGKPVGNVMIDNVIDITEKVVEAKNIDELDFSLNANVNDRVRMQREQANSLARQEIQDREKAIRQKQIAKKLKKANDEYESSLAKILSKNLAGLLR